MIEALTKVKGIGRWSAEMFLMFRLLRPDVLPVGDYGIRKAMQRAYRLISVKFWLPRPTCLTGLRMRSGLYKPCKAACPREQVFPRFMGL